jgi:D-alanyl-D-alanine carboxypeptidase/D-alanyl-D-alanine-endopeptidase (penicillin-binding protein 4)
MSPDTAVSLQYTGELTAAFIEQACGSGGRARLSTRAVPEGPTPVYVHRQSRTLSEILVELLRAPNNYIANPVAGPVSHKKSLAKVRELFAPHALHGHDGGMDKTDTMERVCSLAGYANTSSHGEVRFVISLASNDGVARFRLLRTVESALY